ncbi:MAG TPA: hypothetical protein VJT13_15530 [Xanthobacteraceae bacterium]|nr:hypothetical protein [Xanthobacteraceae bacterium]
MRQVATIRTLRFWFRFARRRSRNLRRMCVSVLSIAIVIDRAIERGRDLLSGGPHNSC